MVFKSKFFVLFLFKVFGLFIFNALKRKLVFCHEFNMAKSFEMFGRKSNVRNRWSIFLICQRLRIVSSRKTITVRTLITLGTIHKIRVTKKNRLKCFLSRQFLITYSAVILKNPIYM